MQRLNRMAHLKPGFLKKDNPQTKSSSSQHLFFVGGLPKELWGNAFTFLDKANDLVHAAQVCKAWKDDALDELNRLTSSPNWRHPYRPPALPPSVIQRWWGDMRRPFVVILLMILIPSLCYLLFGTWGVSWIQIVSLIGAALLCIIMESARISSTLRYETAWMGPDPWDDRGWKRIHGDVFRRPRDSGWLILLAAIGSTAVGPLSWAILYYIYSIFGLESYSYLVIPSLVLCGAIGAGALHYIAHRLAFIFQAPTPLSIFLPGGRLRLIALLPMLLFCFSGYMPFDLKIITGALVAVSVIPLPAPSFPWRFNPVTLITANPVDQPISQRKWYLKRPTLTALTGLYIFLASFCVFQQGDMLSLLLGLTNLTIIATAVTHNLVYFLLSLEDYNWWWPSFLAPASSGLYVALLLWWNGVLTPFTLCLASIFLTTFLGGIGFLSCTVYARLMYFQLTID